MKLRASVWWVENETRGYAYGLVSYMSCSHKQEKLVSSMGIDQDLIEWLKRISIPIDTSIEVIAS